MNRMSNMCNEHQDEINTEKQIVGKDTHVYCTNCKYFCVKNKSEDAEPQCFYEKVCNLLDSEDSKAHSERPMYQEARAMKDNLQL